MSDETLHGALALKDYRDLGPEMAISMASTLRYFGSIEKFRGDAVFGGVPRRYSAMALAIKVALLSLNLAEDTSESFCLEADEWKEITEDEKENADFCKDLTEMANEI